MTRTREQIIDAADQLFYEQGFEHTSFSNIADTVKISRGNFYHHFKTKDDILQAVIDSRLTRTRQMLAQWEQDSATPQARIVAFIDILIRNRAEIMRHGCPVGTLCTELAKLDHGARESANQIMTLFRDWLREQFKAMGCPRDADIKALHLLARTQGVATLAQAFGDEAFIRHEVEQMRQWLAQCTPDSNHHRPPRKA
ncbi:TetR/AcrR family transcriptional regulator [Hydrogenophaga laconesensis]|uniref:AcrR family transcriptional regulator n=1 Tax=Hydrogenophaga laconesensis TaxID=1805971 RepID=A0ABU1VE42_9BURK|nr:TetR/AcrR family transcriptional regulator [Hydrogenophaga laconesensis]MDR7095734.1 AcrR family transcriptional regulator [Hydrogenophaga laconesensis]